MASEKITAIIDSVKELSVLELKELIDAYCEEFGVSAVAAAAPAAAGAAAAAHQLAAVGIGNALYHTLHGCGNCAEDLRISSSPIKIGRASCRERVCQYV